MSQCGPGGHEALQEQETYLTIPVTGNVQPPALMRPVRMVERKLLWYTCLHHSYQSDRDQIRLPILWPSFWRGAALLLPPGEVARALVGGAEDLMPTVTAGLWLTKLFLLISAGLVWLVNTDLEHFAPPSEPVATRGISTGLEWTRTDLYVILALFAVSVVVRIPGLNQGLWYDEIQTLVDYVRLPAGEILTRYDSANNHILFSILAHSAIQLFGESAWALRLPAALLGALSIPIVYVFGRQIAPRTEAFLAAAFLSVSYHHVWFSQNARGYAGLLVGTVLASSVFLSLLAARRVRPELVIAYALISALSVWTHLTAAVTVGAHGVVWLLATLDRPRHLSSPTSLAILAALALAGLFSLALYGPILPQMAGTLSGGGSSPVDTAWKDPSWMVFESMRNLSRGIPGGWGALLVVVIVALIGIQSYGRQSPLVLTILLLPAALMGILILGTGRNLWPRFFFFSAGFCFVDRSPWRCYTAPAPGPARPGKPLGVGPGPAGGRGQCVDGTPRLGSQAGLSGRPRVCDGGARRR